MNNKSPESLRCQICGGSFSSLVETTDKMYGKTVFYTYAQCKECECLQCIEIPKDLSQHYPSEYYSFKKQTRVGFKRIKRILKLRLIFSHPDFLSTVIRFFTKNYDKFWIYRKMNIKKTDRILDVGTGNGEHVLDLKDAGFFNSLGLDPYIQTDIFDSEKLIVKKGNLNQDLGQFNLITMHHSFEHMNNQKEVLRRAHSCLEKYGKLLIRVPTVTSTAYKNYLQNWFQLDAPRHIFLHSHKSIKYLANLTGFKVLDLWCDSNELQFLISNQYSSGIFGDNERSIIRNPKNIKLIDKSEILKYKKEAEKSNKNLLGDQICIVLEKQ